MKRSRNLRIMMSKRRRMNRKKNIRKLGGGGDGVGS